ncbi:MAG: 30S ribosome-binding factor RbfA [Oscillospiraceae bacterium]|nr:30S ribosome-binding factor RbfA [Oscillospiraceae bacterium]
MASNRLQRTNEDIKIRLSELLREVKDPRVSSALVSVTATETTSDLSHCKVYVSALGIESEKEFMKGLKSASGWLRHELGSSLRLRNVPELHFEFDRSIEYGAHINKMLSELNISSDEGEGEA